MHGVNMTITISSSAPASTLRGASSETIASVHRLQRHGFKSSLITTLRVQDRSPSSGKRLEGTATDLCLSGPNSEQCLITLLNAFWTPFVEVRCSSGLLYSPEITWSSLGNWQFVVFGFHLPYFFPSELWTMAACTGPRSFPDISFQFIIHYSSCHTTPHTISPRCWQCHKNHKQTKY